MKAHIKMVRKSYFLGLLIECPFRNAKESCCIESFRKKELFELIECVEQCNSVEIDDLISKHKACYLSRQKQMFKTSQCLLEEFKQ